MPNEDLTGWSAERLRAVTWRKSSSSGQNACVEVATLDTGDVAVRHSRHPSGPALVFTPAEWSAFLTGVEHGEFAVPAGSGNATVRGRTSVGRAKRPAQTSEITLLSS